jgi:hypothetical protein
MPDARAANARPVSEERDGTHMSRWWHELTGLLARRRSDQIVARRLRTYVGTSHR